MFKKNFLIKALKITFLSLIIFLSSKHLYKAFQYQIFIRELCKFEETSKLIDKDKITIQTIVNIEELNKYKNKKRILSDVVKCVTKDQIGDLAKTKKWVNFLQYKIAHPIKPPLVKNGMAIFDPIWLLENKIGQCGQTNRLVLDGIETLGIKGRLVQLDGHVIAEAYLNNDFLALDADALNNGNYFYDSNGNILSAIDIHSNLFELEKLNNKVYLETCDFKWKELCKPYLHFDDRLSPFDWLKNSFKTKPYYYIKTATEIQLNNAYYGWDFYYQIN